MSVGNVSLTEQVHYHAFLSHNGDEKSLVEQLANKLEKQGICCWLDKWNLVPGDPWQAVIEEALGQCDTCVVFFGPHGLAPWHNEEMRLAIQRRVNSRERKLRVLPVILPGGQRAKESDVPGFLQGTTWVDFRQSLDEEDALHRLVCGIRGVPPGRRLGATIQEGECPYIGLETFQPEDAPLFFGRAAIIQELVDRLRNNFRTPKEERFLALIGASGSGKSSVAMAGLIPAIQSGELPGSANWPLVRCRPGAHPWESLQIALASNHAISSHIAVLPAFITRPEDEQRRLHLISRLALHGRPETDRLFILIDQFEEIFTLCNDEAERRRLIDNALYATSVAAGRTIVVLTMRADFYGQCASYPGLRAALSDHQLLIGPLREEELREAIESPAQLAGGELEPGLMELLLVDMKGQAGALPFLEHALSKLWEKRDGRRLTAKAYMDMGRLGGALDVHAEEFFTKELSAEEQALCRQILVDLVHPGEGAADTKKRLSVDDVATNGTARAVLKKLADERLVTTDRAEKPQATQVELAHEALIGGWHRLGSWVNENRERSRLKERLLDSAREWQKNDKREDFLYRGVQLAAAEESFGPSRESLSKLGREFLEASIAERRQLQRQQRHRQRLLAGAALVFALLAVAAGAAAIFGFLQRNEAERQKTEAELQKADTAKSLCDLAFLRDHMGDYAKAEPLFQQALQIRTKVLGPEHPDTAASLDSLALLYDHMGDYAKAEPLFQQALRIRQKVLGPEHPDTALGLNNLAALYDHMGDYAKAELLFKQALQIRKKVLSPEHPDTAASLDSLALHYDHMGDYAEAEPLFQQALQIRTKVLGPEHPDTAASLNSLALLYDHMGDYTKAEPLFKQALQIRNKVLGHPDTAASLNSLALLYDHMGDYTKAEPLFKQALQIRTKVLGPEHLDTAASLDSLALLYDHMGDYAEAEPLFKQALQIRNKVLGPEHPTTAIGLSNLALLKFELGRIDEAKTLADQESEAQLNILSKMFSFTSEQQRLAYSAIFNPYSLFALLKGSEADLASAILRYKGVVLDSIIEDRLVAEASKESEDQKLVEQLNLDKRQLGQLLLQPPKKLSAETNQRIETLEGDVEKIERQLAQHVAGLGRTRWALSVTVEQVQAVIPNDGALIEYLRYSNYLGKGKSEPWYGAMVLASTGQPSWIPLTNAKELDRIVRRYQRLVRNPASDDDEVSANLEKLYEQLWAPIEQSLPPDAKRVIISPDSQLNFVSFTTLLDSDKRFLAEKYTMQYVASGRDLLRNLTPAINTSTETVVFANPDFTLNPTGGTMRSGENRDIEDLLFSPLEGTQRECDILTSKFEAWHWKAETFTGKEATKEALLRIHSPYILHLATSGFFEPEEPAPDTDPNGPQLLGIQSSVKNSRFFKNPMHRGGLALAGANITLGAWKRGEAPPVENDGIVTAEDVAALDLKGTWLVTLSACDTGSGEAKAGEGVMGLRRGFIEAGAHNLLMALGLISDDVTVQIMSDFYEAAHESGNASLALAKVQREWLIKIREHNGLAKAVYLVGPFIMSSQGKQ